MTSLEIFRISLPIENAFNGSVLDTVSGECIIFRYGQTGMGSCLLRPDLSPQADTLHIYDKPRQGPDVRFFRIEDEWFMIGSMCRPGEEVARVELSRAVISKCGLLEIAPIARFDTVDGLTLRRTERNWMPLVHNGKILFVYSLAPRKILEFDERTGTCRLSYEETGNCHFPMPFSDTNYEPCTPCVRLDDCYLGVFRTEIKSIGYCSGFYTLEAKPPFALTSVSMHPVLLPDCCGGPKAGSKILPLHLDVDGTSLRLSGGENGRVCIMMRMSLNWVRDSLQKVQSHTDKRPAQRWFGHSGDLGDIIYSLPTIRAAGGGDLMLFHQEGKTSHGMTDQRVAAIKPLLELQPYISKVVWCPDGHTDHDLNGFRDHAREGRNLADQHLATHGFDFRQRHKQWIKVDYKCQIAPVVFVRSERYHNVHFPWRRIWAKYRRFAIFLGLPSEHQAFCKEVGPVEYIFTANLLEAARIMGGSRLCVTNQTALHAVAEAMKLNLILEVAREIPNCNFERLGRINGWGEYLELPDIKFGHNID